MIIVNHVTSWMVWQYWMSLSVCIQQVLYVIMCLYVYLLYWNKVVYCMQISRVSHLIYCCTIFHVHYDNTMTKSHGPNEKLFQTYTCNKLQSLTYNSSYDPRLGWQRGFAHLKQEYGFFTNFTHWQNYSYIYMNSIHKLLRCYEYKH